MLQVSYGGLVPEGEIRGSRSDLQTLARLLRVELGTLICSTLGSAYPYEHLLEKIVVKVSSEGALRVSVIENSDELEIRGDSVCLSVLADNIEELAIHGDEGAHWHLEYIPEIPYVAAGSYPFTIVLI